MWKYIDLVVKSLVSTYSTLWILEAMATTTFILRMLSRAFITRDIGWEDGIMALGWAVSLIGSVLVTWSVNAMIAVTKSVGSVMEANIVLALKLTVIANAMVSVALWLPKISVALVLVHLLQPSRWMRRILIYGSVLSLLLLCIPSVIITFVQCNPIPGRWDPKRYKPTCWNPDITVKVYIVTSASSVFWDLVHAVYPATVLWKMKSLRATRKVEISILMGLGIISGGVGIYKTTLLPLLEVPENRQDATVAAAHVIAMWTNMEANFIISAGCIPFTTPVYRLVKKHVVVAMHAVGNRICVCASGLARRKRKRRRNSQSIEDGYHCELAERRASNKPLPPIPIPIPCGRDSRTQIYVRDDFEIQLCPAVDSKTITRSQIPKASWLDI